MLRTCVLYIDMRKSTDLSLAHRPETLAKLYTSFVRAMTRTARYYGGHVRGIIGDRVMVLFDVDQCFTNAVNCAIAMNTVAKHIINESFKSNEVRFGIGIDYGRMLVTKTGIRRHGSEQSSYRNLVWLGRPANVASKLTDAANKPAEHEEIDTVRVAYETRVPPTPFGSGLGALNIGAIGEANSPFTGLGALYGLNVPATNPLSSLTDRASVPFGVLNSALSNTDRWEWVNETPSAFLSQFEIRYAPVRLTHKRADFGSFYMMSETVETRASTPSILMTKAVWNGFKREQPSSTVVRTPLFNKVNIAVSGYADDIYGGQPEFPGLKA